MSSKKTLLYLLVVVISASGTQATGTGFSRQKIRIARVQHDAQSPLTQQNGNGRPRIYNVYGAIIDQHNITYNSGNGNIRGAEITQSGITYIRGDVTNQTDMAYNGTRGGDGGSRPSARHSNTTDSPPTLNEMKKAQIELENSILRYYLKQKSPSSQCADGESNTDRQDELRNLLAKVREEGNLITELHYMYRSYVNILNLIAIECSGDKCYDVLKWISVARFVVLDRLEDSANTFAKLPQC